MSESIDLSRCSIYQSYNRLSEKHSRPRAADIQPVWDIHAPYNILADLCMAACARSGARRVPDL